MNESFVQRASLYFKNGPSDKEYHASIEEKDGWYFVNFAYGRRGATLQTGTKTQAGVDLETATRIFTRLVSEKKAKGYTEAASGSPYEHSENTEYVAGILPQLLNSIDEAEVARLLESDNWCAQEKFDGKRILLQKTGGAIHSLNRRGLLVGLPSPMVAAAKAFPGDFILDGETVGETLHAFDLLSQKGVDLRKQSYYARATALVNLFASCSQRNIRLAPTAWSREEKFNLFTQLRESRKEGIVFKHRNAAYTAGRPNTGGTQLKYKFYATLSAVVAVINSKRSIEIKLFNDRGLVSAGNVSIPVNFPMPKVNQVVEVRYLYAFRESGALFQPVYLGSRSDVNEAECHTRQLKFKNGEDEP